MNKEVVLEADQGVPLGLVLRDWLNLGYRRRWWLIAPGIIGTAGGVAAAFLMQPVYESTATILIESQQVPTSLVASPITSYADERIAKIRQQIISRNNLVELINRNELYPSERGNMTLAEIVELMRSAIRVDLVSANSQPNAPRSANTTIAFNLTFDYRDPKTTQAVTEQLTGMFIDADLRRRTEQASGTAAFLSRRADELEQRLKAAEGQIAQVRAQYNGALPDQLLTSTQSASMLRAEMARIDIEIQSVLQANSAIATRLAEQAGIAPEQTELSRAEATLERLQAVYSDRHPDVVAARGVVARLRESGFGAANDVNRRSLEAELAAGRSRVSVLNQRRAQLQAEVQTADRMAALSPQATYELTNLQRNYDNLKEQYESIRNRQLEAQVAANLEAEEKGERFSLVEAPALPEEPVRPNRPFVVLLGLLLGLGAGGAAILLHQLLTRPLIGPSSIARITGQQPLALLPNQEKRAWRERLRSLGKLLTFGRRTRTA
jgi:polysaccharide biosynthesis transport protein